MGYEDNSERRRRVELTDSEIDEIATRAADKAVVKITTEVYATIGKSIVSKFLAVIGIITVSMIIFLNSKGILK